MKKLINLFSLLLCFSFLASNSINAQNLIRNTTECTFSITVEYGDLNGGCIIVGSVTFNVPPSSITQIPILDLYSPITVSGNYDGVDYDGCAFYVEDPCNGNQQINTVNPCTLGCGNYTAAFYTGLDIILI